jgi:hypothetical protein
MPVIAVTEPRSPAGIERAFAIRRCVFVEEQGVDEALEFDALDAEARHLLATVDGAPAGTLRIRLLEGAGSPRSNGSRSLRRSAGTGSGAL